MKVFLNFFKKFLPYIKLHYGYFAIAIFGSILVAVSTAGVTYLISPLLDGLSNVTPKKDLFGISALSKEWPYLVPILLIVVYFFKASGFYIQAYFMNYIGQNIVRLVREDMLRHMLKLELGFFNKMRSGELLSRITNDIGVIRSAVSNYITDLVRESITIIGLLFVVMYQSWILGLIGIIVIPLAVIPVTKILKSLRKYARGVQEQNADITSKLNEIFNNAEIIKASNGENIEVKQFSKQNLDFLKISMKAVRASEATTPLLELLGAFALSFIIIIATYQIQNGTLTAGEFSSFAAALFMLYTPMKRLIYLYAKMQESLIASERIYQVLNREPLIKDGENVLKTHIDSIKLNDAWLSYDTQIDLNDAKKDETQNNHALKGITLEFSANTITALVGKSGGGKSSIVNLILRLYDASKGEILINGKDIKSYTQKSIREQISIVTQRIFIFNDSIASNVAYGEEIDEKKLKNALELAQAWDFVASLPEGIYTKLDEFGANLSGGQRQRIAIARALYKNPSVLILDEATSALDSATEESIKEVIDSIRKDKIIILIAHRPSTIELADKVVNIREGVVESIRE